MALTWAALGWLVIQGSLQLLRTTRTPEAKANRQLALMVADLAQGCPRKIDEESVLESVAAEAGPPVRLTLRHRLLWQAKADLARFELPAFEGRARAGWRSRLDGGHWGSPLGQPGAVIELEYATSDGAPATTVVMTAATAR